MGKQKEEVPISALVSALSPGLCQSLRGKLGRVFAREDRDLLARDSSWQEESKFWVV